MTIGHDDTTPRTATHEDPPAPAVWQCLHCTDATGEIDWLQKALDFVLTFRTPESGPVAHAELRRPEGGGVMLGDLSECSDDAASAAPVGSARSFLVTADSDAAYSRALAAGAEVVQPLHDTDHGDHSFAVRDPEGNIWTVGVYAGQPFPTTGGATA